MKKQLKLYSLLLLFLATSCIQGGKKEATEASSVKKENIVGIWGLTKESLKIAESGDSKVKNQLITKLELRSDSSAIISFANSTSKHEITGTWSQNKSKSFGNNNIGIEFTVDVAIKFWRNDDSLEIIGLKVEFNNGRITLNGNDVAYEKLT